jgi:hypothetical protein
VRCWIVGSLETGGYLARKGAEKLGADQDVAEIAEGVGGVASGVAGELLRVGPKLARKSHKE